MYLGVRQVQHAPASGARCSVVRSTHANTATVSTESIASPPLPAAADSTPTCSGCGAPLADDQRYCLECGERRTPMSSVLLGGPPGGAVSQSQPSRPVPPAPGTPPAGDTGRGGAVTLIAAVGVLLLAMGVGVLIGRSGGSKTTAVPPQVITVSAPSGPGAASTAPVEASFTDDWPAGTSGYTVQLQTLPQAGTQLSAVEAAKTTATANGAKGVGALKSGDFSSLTAGNYVIYAGVYHTKAAAEKELAGLKRKFAGASVIAVSTGSSSTSGSHAASSSRGSGAGSSQTHPAPSSVVESLKGAKGKSYEEKSKNLPDVIETG
jgi:hypothetical protein